MKKIYALLLTVCFMVLSLPAFSMEYIVGARGGYFMWDSWIKELAEQFNDMGTGSGVLYGPVASILFTEDLSLSVSGLFGNQNTSGISKDIPQDADQNKTVKYNFDTFRMDIDSALSYRVAENIKIFAGYKYWYLETKYNAIDYRYNSTTNVLEALYQEDMKAKQPFQGPAFGIGFSMPLGNKGFFVAANLSGIYMRGKTEFAFEPRDSYDGNTAIPWELRLEDSGTVELDMEMYGINIEPSIGINPGEGLPIITLGARYQQNKFKATDMPADMEGMNEGWMKDQIYGVFVGVLYQI